jgi:hypothetical protein
LTRWALRESQAQAEACKGQRATHGERRAAERRRKRPSSHPSRSGNRHLISSPSPLIPLSSLCLTPLPHLRRPKQLLFPLLVLSRSNHPTTSSHCAQQPLPTTRRRCPMPRPRSATRLLSSSPPPASTSSLSSNQSTPLALSPRPNSLSPLLVSASGSRTLPYPLPPLLLLPLSASERGSPLPALRRTARTTITLPLRPRNRPNRPFEVSPTLLFA